MFNSNRISVTVAVVLKVTCVFVSLKLSRVWYNISRRLCCLTEPFQKLCCVYFKGCISWIAGSVCRTLPPLLYCTERELRERGDGFVLFVYTVASVGELIRDFFFQRRLGSLENTIFSKKEFCTQVFYRE